MRSKTREDELNLLVRNQQPDVVVVSEAELGPHDTIVIPGYILFCAAPAPTGKCRLVILLKANLADKAMMLENSHTDVWLNLKLTSPLTIVGVYRQWSNTEQADLAAFHQRCSTHLGNNKAVITGDMNLDFGRKSDRTYSRYSMAAEHFATMEGLGLQYVGPYTPTYYSHGLYKSADGEYTNRTSIIDHVYLLGDSQVEVSVLSVGATDHLPVRVAIPFNSVNSQRHKWIRRRPLANLNGQVLCWALERALDEAHVNLYSCGDVDVVHDIIVTAITKALDWIAPYRMVPVDKTDRPPLFLSADTLQAMRLRDSAARKHSEQYRSLRNKVCRLVQRDRLKSSLKLISQSRNKPRKLWSLARSFRGASTNANLPSSLLVDEGRECKDDKELASTLNSFFIDKIANIRNGIPQRDSDGCTSQHGPRVGMEDKFCFKFPSAGKVKAIIMSLKNTGAVGTDDVPVSVLKLGASVLASPIAHLVRLSFQTAKVPCGFKSAIVRPIYKGKGKATTSASSYRPVSILTAMSKILEKCAFETLVDFLEPILPAGQYGFREGRSTTAAVADAHGQWSSIRASGQTLGVIGFDLTAAFDTLDATLLCTKLANIGICGRENDWFRDYLSDRKQCVMVGGSRSPFATVRYGVPQGSLLGPVLFLAMVADMPKKTGLVGHPSRGYVAYADDLCAWSYGSSVKTIKEDLAVIASSVSRFASANYLSLSVEKTQILWSGLPVDTESPAVNIGEVSVAPLPTIEILGVSFDRNLTPAPFLASQLKAAAPILATVKRLAFYLAPSHLAEIARAFLVGKLTYAAVATHAPRLTRDDPMKSAAHKLQLCINDAARTILGKSRADKMRIETLLTQTGLPSLNRAVVKGVAIECWRAMNLSTPLGTVICGGHRASRPTRMVTSNKLPPPFKFRKESMAWYAVQLWNLHEDLRNATTLHGARRAAARIAATCPL